MARRLRWDEGFRFGSSDIEFCWRAWFAGCRFAFVEDAVMRVRLRGSLTSLAHQYFRYGRSEPQLYRRFRAHGMVSPESSEPMPPWQRLVEIRGELTRTRPTKRTGYAPPPASSGSRGGVEHRVLVR